MKHALRFATWAGSASRTVLAVAAVACLTFSSVSPALAQTAPPKSSAAGSLPPLESYLTHLPTGILSIQPAAIHSQIKNQELLNSIAELEADKKFAFDDISIRDLAEIQISADEFDPDQPPPTPEQVFTFILRHSKPFDWQPVVSKQIPDAVATTRGQANFYFSKENQRGFIQLDPQTVLIANQKVLVATVQRINGARIAPLPEPVWLPQWQANQKHAVRFAIDVDILKPNLEGHEAKLGMFGNMLINQIRFGVQTINIDNQNLSLQLLVTTRRAEDAPALAQMLNMFLNAQKEQVAAIYKMLSESPDEGSSTSLPRDRLLFSLAHEFMSSLKVEQKESLIQVTAAIDRETLENGLQVLAPAIGASRAAARRLQSSNNLKQIALAYHNYHDTYGRLPVSQNFQKPGAKYPHSWRVAILPYIEEAALYEQYRFDEPWDSEHNRQLIDKMPRVFRSPDADPNSTSPNYFLITGPNTISALSQPAAGSDSPTPVTFRQITDGTSMTLLAVEGQKDIPWTQPEDLDLPVDATARPEGLGGVTEGGFNAALLDGSVRFIANEVDNQIFRALISPQGGEIIPQF